MRRVGILEELYDHSSLRLEYSVGTVATLLLGQREDLNAMGVVGSQGSRGQVMTLNHQ